MEKIEVNGRKYRAVESLEPGKCGSCAFKKGFGCLLAEVKGDALSYCSGKHRLDGKSVQFVTDHQAG